MGAFSAQAGTVLGNADSWSCYSPSSKGTGPEASQLLPPLSEKGLWFFFTLAIYPGTNLTKDTVVSLNRKLVGGISEKGSRASMLWSVLHD